MNTTLIIVLVVVLVAVIAAGALAALRLSRTRRLRARFGPEYDRAVADAPNRGTAEERLLERERRHDELDLRPLSDGARERYIREWTTVQERFVDAPAASTRDADRLITALMHDRVYPVEDYEQRLADLSVDHAHTLEHYRTAHAISTRISDNEAETEEMRQSMVHYRELFAALLTPTPPPTTSSPPPTALHPTPTTPNPTSTTAHPTSTTPRPTPETPHPTPNEPIRPPSPRISPESHPNP
ncbi:MAG TPA: hypothetical protein VGL93_18765, partial [Streptosporangiaceae bacterium]